MKKLLIATLLISGPFSATHPVFAAGTGPQHPACDEMKGKALSRCVRFYNDRDAVGFDTWSHDGATAICELYFDIGFLPLFFGDFAVVINAAQPESLGECVSLIRLTFGPGQ